jgi:hypothetical protein
MRSMNEWLFILVLAAFMVLMVIVFGWPYLFLSGGFCLGWIVRGCWTLFDD